MRLPLPFCRRQHTGLDADLVKAQFGHLLQILVFRAGQRPDAGRKVHGFLSFRSGWARGRNGLQNLAPFGRQAVEEFLGVVIAVAGAAPTHTVAEDCHPPFARVDATAASVHQTVHKEQRVSLL